MHGRLRALMETPDRRVPSANGKARASCRNSRIDFFLRGAQPKLRDIEAGHIAARDQFRDLVEQKPATTPDVENAGV